MEMNKKSLEKNFDEKIRKLTIADNYMFFSVMTNNDDICKEVVEICIGRAVHEIRYKAGEASMKLSPDGKGVRLDVYLEDENRTLYDIEMQAVVNMYIGRRTRYYDSVMSVNMLNSGQDYRSLPDSYVIFICLEDPFGKNRAVYRFCNRERDDHDLTLEDGSYKILINARGDESGCSEGMKQLMAAARGETITDDGLDRRIAEAVSRMKADAEWRMEYMLYEIEMNERWEAGFAEGVEKGREEGREEGLKAGQREGELFTLYDLVLSGDLPENVAVKKSGRSRKDFCAGLEKYRQSRRS